jgi:APA family basic amino acid/polyamine antiporter
MKADGNSRSHLKKILGLSFGIAVVIGGTIGVGILRTPGDIASILPIPWLILACWSVGGLYILLGTVSYAELSSMLPKAGGAYNYIKRAFGNYAGFITGWFDYIQNVVTPAYFCIVLGEYSFLLVPALSNYRTYVAIAFLTFFTLINLPGIKNGSITQQITSAIKIVLFLVLIGCCFFLGDHAHTQIIQNTSTPALIKGSIFIAIFLSLQLIIGTYDGWMAVSFFAEENSNPGKTIPRSYFFGALTVMILYILINAAILYVLPVNSLARSTLAASDAAKAVLGNKGSVFIIIFAIFSLTSILNAYILIPARILFGLSRDGFFIKRGTMVNKGGTPVVALLISFAIGVFLILYSSFDELFSLGAFMSVSVTGFAYASLIKLRRSEPNLYRPYRAWGYPFSTWLTLLVTTAILIGFGLSDKKSLAVILIVTVVSYPSYLLLVNKKNKENRDV